MDTTRNHRILPIDMDVAEVKDLERCFAEWLPDLRVCWNSAGNGYIMWIDRRYLTETEQCITEQGARLSKIWYLAKILRNNRPLLTDSTLTNVGVRQLRPLNIGQSGDGIMKDCIAYIHGFAQADDGINKHRVAEDGKAV